MSNSSVISIRPNKKQCTCLSCKKVVPRDYNMLHLDCYGSRHSICLDCTAEFGWYAKEAQRRERLQRGDEL